MNNEHIIRDLTRKYSGTFLLINDPKFKSATPTLMYCHGLERTAVGGSIHLKSPKTGVIIYNLPADVHIQYKFPNVGSFQLKGISYFFARNPARQWRRGICAENAVIKAPGMSGTFAPHQRVDFTPLEAAYAGVQYSLIEAVKLLEDSKYISVAVHGGYTVSRSVNDEEYELYYRLSLVCCFNKSTGKITELYNKLMVPTFVQMGLDV